MISPWTRQKRNRPHQHRLMSRDVVQRLANILQRDVNCWDTLLVQAKHKHPQPGYADIKFIQTLGGMKTHRHTHTQEGGKHHTQIHKRSLTVSLEDLQRRRDAAAGFNSVLIKRYRRGNRWEKLWLGGGGAERWGHCRVKDKLWKRGAMSPAGTKHWAGKQVKFVHLSQFALKRCPSCRSVGSCPRTRKPRSSQGDQGRAELCERRGPWMAPRRIHITVARFNTLRLTSKENPCADLGKHTYGWRCKVFWEVEMKVGYMESIYLYIKKEPCFIVPVTSTLMHVHHYTEMHQTLDWCCPSLSWELAVLNQTTWLQ